ncbi:MAG: Uma2 family endonuclease [Bacteroidota bacterium]
MTKPIAYDYSVDPGFLWTLERYQRALDANIFTEEDKIELLFGKIIELMPAGTPHEECVTLLADFFRYRFGKDYRYREEKAIELPDLDSAPEPDFVVVVNKSYGGSRPSVNDIHFIAEVASSSLEKDRTVKVALYAEANLAEYWIVNLVNRQIEVHLQPAPEQRIYTSVNIYRETETFQSPFAGEVVVAELLPDAEGE